MAEQDPDATVGQGGVEPLLEALGLPPDASVDDVRAQHVQLLSFLDEAPEQLRPWAEKQVELRVKSLRVVGLGGEGEGLCGVGVVVERVEESFHACLG